MINCLSCGKEYSIFTKELEFNLKKCISCESTSITFNKHNEILENLKEISERIASYVEDVVSVSVSTPNGHEISQKIIVS